jgi:electron transfer flavoprotein alpha/beta subunit
LIIAGERSDDEGQGLVPAAIAHHLRAPMLARVQDIHPSLASPEAVEVTIRAGGSLCKIESTLPLVLSTPPRWRMQASYQPDAPTELRVVETMTLARLGLDPSRVVPRPDLLGVLETASADLVRPSTVEEAAEILCRRS